jgi:hypothetical protein
MSAYSRRCSGGKRPAGQIRDTVILVVCGGNGRERQLAIRPVEKERVAQIGRGFDARKRVNDVVCNTFFVYSLPCLSYHVVKVEQ